LIVDNKVIVELKAVRELIEIHEVQLVNYLKATNIEVGLLLNFGPKLEFKRKVLKYEKQL
jgi:GxxExxY protein